MHVLILHHHLNPGGVTKVIESQIQAIKFAAKNISISIICGDANGRTAFEGCMINQNKIINYLEKKTDNSSLISRVAEITAFIRNNIRNDTVLHCHNLNLGKNPLLLMAVFNLASEGVAVVNHCHDFAEDRPLNMKALNRMIRQTGLRTREVLYPDMPNYHFIVLNTFDYNRILKTGIPAGRVHLMPNPVSLEDYVPGENEQELRIKICIRLSLDSQKKICTYPVRAIRRKNLGEFILLAVLHESTCQFVITQPPKNPDELSGYYRWKEFCVKHGIHIKFEAGDVVNHEDLIRISDFCITTSTREGFGMAFLEPWLVNTPVCGRDLPAITGDLKSYGLEFPGLYNSIRVDSASGTVDFKDLDPEEQLKYITRVRESPGEKEKLIGMNPFLAILFNSIEPDIIFRNRQIILNQFSLANYGKRLLELYKDLSR